jgi:C1A family cysteine protease
VDLPIISRKGRADSGHAIAIVGYTRDGFIIQNSWGDNWGKGGFALLPYEDWLLHATDCWVT